MDTSLANMLHAVILSPREQSDERERGEGEGGGGKRRGTGLMQHKSSLQVPEIRSLIRHVEKAGSTITIARHTKHNVQLVVMSAIGGSGPTQSRKDKEQTNTGMLQIGASTTQNHANDIGQLASQLTNIQHFASF